MPQEKDAEVDSGPVNQGNTQSQLPDTQNLRRQRLETTRYALRSSPTYPFFLVRQEPHHLSVLSALTHSKKSGRRRNPLVAILNGLFSSGEPCTIYYSHLTLLFLCHTLPERTKRDDITGYPTFS